MPFFLYIICDAVSNKLGLSENVGYPNWAPNWATYLASLPKTKKIKQKKDRKIYPSPDMDK